MPGPSCGALRRRSSLQLQVRTRAGAGPFAHPRNRGVREASGEIVAFLDDDAVAGPDWLASILATYLTNPSVGAAGGKVLPIWDCERPAWLTDVRLRSLSLLDLGEASRSLQWPQRLIGANC